MLPSDSCRQEVVEWASYLGTWDWLPVLVGRVVLSGQSQGSLKQVEKRGRSVR